MSEGYRVLEMGRIGPELFSMRVEAPAVAAAARAGQFVILRQGALGERIPLTICGWDKDAGTLHLIFQVMGKSTAVLSRLNAGDSVTDIAGPLGHATEMPDGKRVLAVGGGVGIAALLPIVRALHEAGKDVHSILGARSAEHLILREEVEALSHSAVICTDDGTLGRKGLVTEPLEELLCADDDFCRLWAIGPAPMMKFTTLTAGRFGIPVTVSLNAIMVDGTGMCGACRVSVGGHTKFGCVDGPDFDGHAVDFEELMSRQRVYNDLEREADADYSRNCTCHS